jgi:hypothetical protein
MANLIQNARRLGRWLIKMEKLCPVNHTFGLRSNCCSKILAAAKPPALADGATLAIAKTLSII